MPSRDDLIDDLRSAAFAAGRAISTTDCEAALSGANGDYSQALLALGLPMATAEMERAEAVRTRERAARTRAAAATETMAALRAIAAGGVAAPPSSYTGTKPTSAYALVATSETVLPYPTSESRPPCPDIKPTAPLLNSQTAPSDSAVWGQQLKTTGMTMRGQQLTTRRGVSLARLSSFWGSAKKKPDADDDDVWCETCCVGTCDAAEENCNFICSSNCPCIAFILLVFIGGFVAYLYLITHPIETLAVRNFAFFFLAGLHSSTLTPGA